MRKKAKENIKLKTPREYESQTHRFGYVLSLNIDKKKRISKKTRQLILFSLKKERKERKKKDENEKKVKRRKTRQKKNINIDF